MRKLNQLSDMTPNDLKEVLIEVAQIKSTSLDFEAEFRGIWSKLEHEGKVTSMNFVKNRMNWKNWERIYNEKRHAITNR